VVTGSTLQLSWPVNYVGWTMQVQTNASSGGNSSDWSNVPGSTATNQFFTSFDPTSGGVLFHLINLSAAANCGPSRRHRINFDGL
jgi:hypothetical protein